MRYYGVSKNPDQFKDNEWAMRYCELIHIRTQEKANEVEDYGRVHLSDKG